MSFFRHAIDLLTNRTPEHTVSLRWLWRRPSVVDRRFKRRATVSQIANDNGLQEIAINGEIFVWPAGASVEALLQIVSELQNNQHPNQYLWRETKIKSGDVVLDIGACEGGFAARAAESGCRVIAIEPSRTMIRTMQRLFQLRGLEMPTIANCLLGSAPNRLHYLEHAGNPGKSRVVSEAVPESYPVDVLKLDDLVVSLGLSRLDFIKCDAEGADVDILKSGQKTLAKFRPKLAICTYHRDNDFTELYRFLSEFEYRIQGKGFLHAPNKFRIVMLHAW
jgi:FkbM family methyltransferase